MKIVDVKAQALSVPVEDGIVFGIGKVLRRDTVLVRIETEDGIVGYGESHHGRAAGSIAHVVNSLLRYFLIGEDATDVVGIWQRIYTMQLRSHGLGAATSIAMSGIDQALWDIRGKAVGWPLYKLLGGSARKIKAYAGGVSLGWSEPASLCEEVAQALEGNYKAVKLRGGDTPARDIARVAAVRKAFGDDLTIMVDANTNYTVADVLKVLPAFEELGVEWLEEPFAPHDHRSYATADRSNVPLAAGENHYTRFEFHRLIEDGHVGILQPDLSKAGGITEVLRIAALGSAWKLPICPHTATTGLNMAVTIHVLASIDNAGYFEGDISEANLFRDELVSTPYTVATDGTVSPLERPGIGVDVDEDFARAHPFIDGLAYAETPAQGAR
ncbi:mandelate racemase/muconate lactonizing enzyme family protein [Kaistia terrae]|uniref:Mandelate racemase/muconate lactonizing enzyme family protein n=1 Tax=Kaistia terrae TaxID=537017 RepID=A0ABW0Q4X3_9HYPH|nr:mandelate racemase/muconate lactonizing enzyme family protein [Kaistia terrae]MCX5579739.1 mandelate racemase/muconate lactonizing enzyme family protein [Kaistia terrae]